MKYPKDLRLKHCTPSCAVHFIHRLSHFLSYEYDGCRMKRMVDVAIKDDVHETAINVLTGPQFSI